MAPPGTKLLVHSHLDKINSWDLNAEFGWYVVPSLKHYRCAQWCILNVWNKLVWICLNKNLCMKYLINKVSYNLITTSLQARTRRIQACLQTSLLRIDLSRPILSSDMFRALNLLDKKLLRSAPLLQDVDLCVAERLVQR